MNFNFYGDKKNKKLLILSPIFSTDSSFKDIIDLFSNYYIIMPDFNSRNTDFISFENDARLVENFLVLNNFKSIDYGLGFSYGSNIFLNLISCNSIIFNNVTLDGLINFKLNKIIRKIAASKLKSYKKDFLKGNVNKEKIYDRFPGMYDIFEDIIKDTSSNSIDSIVNDALNFNFPKIHNHEYIKFVYGERDPNFKNYKILKNLYPKSKIIKIKGCTHVNFIFKHPHKFLEIIEK